MGPRTNTSSYEIDAHKYEHTGLVDARVERRTFRDMVNDDEETTIRVAGTDGDQYAYSARIDAPKGAVDRSRKVEKGVAEVARKLENGEGESMETTLDGTVADELSP